MNVFNELKKIKCKTKREFIKENKEVIIYGAGNVGRDIYLILKKYGIKVKFFIDANAKNLKGQLNNMRIYPLEKIKKPKEKINVIIAIFNAFVNLDEIIGALLEKGFNKIITFYEFYFIFSNDLGERFFMQKREYFLKNKDKIIKTMELFLDEKSKKLYEQVIKFRLTGILKDAPLPDKNYLQYFPDDVPGLEKISSIVDCGAYTGDTINDLYKKYGKVREIIAFEPDLKNFIKLCEFVRKNKVANNIFLINAGVYSKTGELYFFNKHTMASYFSKKGDMRLPVVMLDDILNNETDLIKMDIEGLEYDALLGAEKFIKKYIPNLAICVYHRPDDLWKIPNLLNNWNLNYKFYLRVFWYYTFELVLFAIKNQNIKGRKNV